MKSQFVVGPQDVKKSWVSKLCLLSEREAVSNKLSSLGIEHCIAFNEWGNLYVYVPEKHLYNLIGIINIV